MFCFSERDKSQSKGVDYGKSDGCRCSCVGKVGNSDYRTHRIRNFTDFWSRRHGNHFGYRARHLGALIPGVSITIKHTDSGLTRSVVSSETGNYVAPALPVGPYEVTAMIPGFKQQIRSGINLVVGQEAVVDLTLEVGANAETITVNEEAPLVAATTSSTSGLISEQAIKDLPLNGRSFDQLLTMNVGVSNSSTNTLNNGWTAFSVAGKRPETNRFVINGIDYI